MNWNDLKSRMNEVSYTEEEYRAEIDRCLAELDEEDFEEEGRSEWESAWIYQVI